MAAGFGPKMRRGSSSFSYIAVVSLIALVWTFRTRSRELIIEELDEIDTRLCDPFSEPGYLLYQRERWLDTRWITFGEECPSAPNWISRLEKRDMGSTSWLANRTVLVIGDSVDRNGVEHLANMLGLPRWVVSYEDIHREPGPDWDVRNTPWIVTIPWLNTTFTNGFLYGLDDEDNLAEQVDWHAPGLAEDRVRQLIKPHTDQLGVPPSFISLHTGLWDLAFFGRKDRKAGRGTNAPLTQERLDWWQKRTSSLIETVQATYPGVPIWLRKIHRVGSGGQSSSDDWMVHGIAPAFSNYFTDIRIAQIRDMQEAMGRKYSLPVFDFGHIWEGLQANQDKVHPHLFPGGSAYMQGFLHHMWMETRGREAWRPIRGTVVSPLNDTKTVPENR